MEIKVSNLEKVKDKNIKINDDISMDMRWLKSSDKLNKDQRKTGTDSIINTAAKAIETIYSGEETFATKDVPHKEVVAFVESLNTDQFAKILEYLEAQLTNHYYQKTSRHQQKSKKLPTQPAQYQHIKILRVEAHYAGGHRKALAKVWQIRRTISRATLPFCSWRRKHSKKSCARGVQAKLAEHYSGRHRSSMGRFIFSASSVWTTTWTLCSWYSNNCNKEKSVHKGLIFFCHIISCSAVR